jgi:hypothetical protein
MYKGKREQPRVIEREPEEVDAEYDSVGSDVDMIENEVAPTTRDNQLVSIPKHIAHDYVGNRQSIHLQVEFVGTPEQWAKGLVPTTHRFSSMNGKYFQQNMASKDRANVGADMRFGDSRTIVPVKFTITNKQNQAPFAAGFTCKELEPSTIDKNAGYVYRIPGHTASQTCNVDVFKPNNFVEERMYKLGTMCTLADLEEHIVVKDGSKGKKGFGLIEAGTYVYDTLTSSLRRGLWKDQALTQVQINAIFAVEGNPEASANGYVEVTPKMAADLKNFLSKEIQDVMDRCIDANALEFSLHRADGQSEFNSPQGLIGEIVGNSLIGFPALKEHAGVLSQAPKALSTTYSIGFEANMEFFPF